MNEDELEQRIKHRYRLDLPEGDVSRLDVVEQAAGVCLAVYDRNSRNEPLIQADLDEDGTAELVLMLLGYAPERRGLRNGK